VGLGQSVRGHCNGWYLLGTLGEMEKGKRMGRRYNKDGREEKKVKQSPLVGGGE
jgi:hypothetical protein